MYTTKTGKKKKRNVEKFLTSEKIVQKLKLGYMGSVVDQFVLVYQYVRIFMIHAYKNNNDNANLHESFHKHT